MPKPYALALRYSYSVDKRLPLVDSVAGRISTKGIVNLPKLTLRTLTRLHLQTTLSLVPNQVKHSNLSNKDSFERSGKLANALLKLCGTLKMFYAP